GASGFLHSRISSDRTACGEVNAAGDIVAARQTGGGLPLTQINQDTHGGVRVIREVLLLVWTTAPPLVKRRFFATALLLTVASATAGMGPVVLKALVDGFH